MSGPMEQFKARLDDITSRRDSKSVPYAVAIAADSHGKILHRLESGSHQPNPKNPTRTSNADGTAKPEPFTADTVCWIASCTKLMTTIAVLQCVERGLLSLDADVADEHLPEFKTDDSGIQVLLRIEEDDDGNEQPVYKKRTQKLTLRHLLTHSSGIAYEFTHPKLQAWRSVSTATPEGRTMARSPEIANAMRVPLLFEPGASWVYGYGLDWAGLAVMRCTQLTLEEYMLQHIWAPLGMTSTTFSLQRHRPDLYKRYAGMSLRDDEGNITLDTDGGPIARGAERTHYAGGGGCFSTANDYIRLVSSVLNTVTSLESTTSALPQLLSRTTALDMFTPHHMTPAAQSAMHAMVSNPMAYGLAGNMSLECAVSHGLGGILNLGPLAKSSGRAAGGMQWSGLPNLNWWISPGDGVCGCVFTQVLPPGDVPSFELYREFERAVLQERSGAGQRAEVQKQGETARL